VGLYDGLPFHHRRSGEVVLARREEWLAKHLPTQRRRKVEIALMLAGVFLAGFLAFKDEHLARLDAESKTAAACDCPASIETAA
jgi:hypothetical protein